MAESANSNLKLGFDLKWWQALIKNNQVKVINLTHSIQNCGIRNINI